MTHVTLRQEPVWTVVVGQLELAGMREISRWEGLAKLASPAGQLIVEMPDQRRRSIDDAWSPPAPVRLVSASPDLLAQILAAAEGSTP